jgi:hypothetical protein
MKTRVAKAQGSEIEIVGSALRTALEASSTDDIHVFEAYHTGEREVTNREMFFPIVATMLNEAYKSLPLPTEVRSSVTWGSMIRMPEMEHYRSLIIGTEQWLVDEGLLRRVPGEDVACVLTASGLALLSVTVDKTDTAQSLFAQISQQVGSGSLNSTVANLTGRLIGLLLGN